MKLKKIGIILSLFVRGFFGYGSYVLINIIFVFVALIAFVFLLPFKNLKRRAVSLMLMYFSKAIIFSLNFFQILKTECVGREFLDKKNTIFVSNHLSLLDAIVIATYVPNIFVMLKKNYENFFPVWVLVKCFDFIVIDKSSLESIQIAQEKCKELLAKNCSILIFPEGTRSYSGRIQDFKILAFKIAKEINADVQGLALYQEGTLLSKRKPQFFPIPKEYFCLSILPKISSSEVKDSEMLANMSHRKIAKELEQIKNKRSHDNFKR